VTQPELIRLRLDLAYDGTDFAGWARQPGLLTVQGIVEGALETVLRVETAALTVAGRTDAGVHARGQVAHLDVAELPDDVPALARRCNGVLPADVRIRSVIVAPPGFDARFSALSRRYAYRITDGFLDPLRRHDTVAVPRELDVEAMHAAAQRLLGEHDFAAFCKHREGASTVRRLLRLDVHRAEVITAAVEADAFCHSMVRSLVGALIAVGEGKRDVDWPAGVLAGKQRDSAVTVAPAHGLTLEEVRYPPDAELAQRAEQTRRFRG
jgi:tRNA pseudouridine38-40 synthase